MRRAGVDEQAIEARLARSFEKHANPLQKKAAEYGVKLAQQGHSEDYVREKMYAYIANVEKLDRLAEDGD